MLHTTACIFSKPSHIGWFFSIVSKDVPLTENHVLTFSLATIKSQDYKLLIDFVIILLITHTPILYVTTMVSGSFETCARFPLFIDEQDRVTKKSEICYGWKWWTWEKSEICLFGRRRRVLFSVIFFSFCISLVGRLNENDMTMR